LKGERTQLTPVKPGREGFEMGEIELEELCILRGGGLNVV
jgi:hypothetical protein